MAVIRALDRNRLSARRGRWPLIDGRIRPSRTRSLVSLVEIVDKHDDADRGNACAEAEFEAHTDTELRAEGKTLHQDTGDDGRNTGDFEGHRRLSHFSFPPRFLTKLRQKSNGHWSQSSGVGSNNVTVLRAIGTHLRLR